MSEEDRIRNLMMLNYSQLITYASSLEELRCIDRKEIERLNNKLELISTIVEREFPPNEFITYKMKKILKGSDKE